MGLDLVPNNYSLFHINIMLILYYKLRIWRFKVSKRDGCFWTSCISPSFVLIVFNISYGVLVQYNVCTIS